MFLTEENVMTQSESLHFLNLTGNVKRQALLGGTYMISNSSIFPIKEKNH
jgi:hypothetical protein